MKHNNTPRWFLLSILILSMTYLPFARATAENLLPPQLVIKNASDQLKQNLQDETFTKDFAKITAYVETVIYPSVDFNRISMLVLGKLWKNAEPEQRKKFKQEFKTLLVRTYARAFVEFKEWSIRYLPVKMQDGVKKLVVKTEVLQPGKQAIAVNYRMLQVKGQWKAYDIIIEGVSLVTNYRTSFKNEVARTGSLDSVIEKLAVRNKKALETPKENS